jgi:triphosphatase
MPAIQRVVIPMEVRIAREIELKLAARPGDLPQLKEALARLIAGEAAAEAVRAAPLLLDPALDLGAALQQVGRACLAHYLRNGPATLAGCTEGVHQMRVALRRLRSVVAAFGKALPAADRDFLSAELRRLDDTLAPARNLDVLLGELVPSARDAVRDGSELDPLIAAITEARRTAYDRLVEYLRSPRHSRAMLRLLHWFETHGPHGDRQSAAGTVGEVLPPLLDRRFRAVRKRGKRFRRQTPKERHRLRIAVKKLRYTIELLGSPLVREETRDFLRALRRLQDGLGYASDIRAARDLLDGIAAEDGRLARAGSLLLDWHERTLAAREPELRAGLSRLKHSPRFWREPARAL